VLPGNPERAFRKKTALREIPKGRFGRKQRSGKSRKGILEKNSASGNPERAFWKKTALREIPKGRFG
jgi:hypothetical protein